MITRKFEIVSGYHENIVALNGELTPQFAEWQNCGTFTEQQLLSFAMETEHTLRFTPKAYDKLKDIFDLPNKDEENYQDYIFDYEDELEENN